MRKFAAVAALAACTMPLYAAHYAITSVLVKGLSRSVDGQQATSVILDPQDIGLDAAGNLYLVATYPTRVVKIASDGFVQTIAGGGTATPANGLRATDVSLSNVRRLAVDPQGTVYIADRSRHQVYRIGADGTFTIFAGTTVGYSGDNGPATAAKMNAPLDVALDSQGNLYVLEVSSAHIRKITPQGTITTVAGNGTRTHVEGVQATSSGLSSFVNYIAVDAAGKLYYSDDKLVRSIDTTGIVRTIAGGGSNAGASVPPLSASLGTISGLGAASDGTLYISGMQVTGDEAYPAIRRIPPTGNITTVAGGARRAITGDGGNALSANIAKPGPVTIGPDGAIYFRDYQIVRRIANGNIQTVAGSHSAAAAGEGRPLADSNLRGITAVVRDAQGTFYFSDNFTQSIYRATPDLTRITRIAGTGYPGNTGGDGPGTSIALDRPSDIELGPTGDLFIADTWNGHVRKLTAAGQMSIAAGYTNEEFYASKPCTILNDPETNSVCTMEPNGLRFDKSGNLFIADSVHGRVLKMMPGGGLQHFVGKGSYGTSGDGGPAAVAGMYWPAAIDFDGNGNTYIVDFGDSVVRKVNSGGTISTLAGTRVAGFSGDNGPAANAQLNAPSDVRALADGSVLIFDARNNRVRRVNTNGVIETVAGGASGFAFGDYFEATGVGLTGDSDYSGSLFLEPSGKVWVNDIQRLSYMESGTIFRNWVFNAASFKTGAVAPGEVVTIYGEAIGPATLTSASYQNGNLARTVAGTQVLFNGVPAPLVYVSATQTSAIVPYGVSGTAKLQVDYQGTKSNEIEVLVTPTAPGVFTYSGGAGQIVAVNQDGTFNGAANPHKRGDWMVIFLTGQGLVAPTIGDGVLPTAPSFPATAASFNISVGGVSVPASDIWNGLIYQGVLQVNFKVPENVPAGTASLTVTIGSATSQAATIELK